MHYTRVAIACSIHPCQGHPLTVSFGSEKTVDQFWVSFRRPISDKLFHFFGSWRQPSKVKGDAANLSSSIGFWLWLETSFFNSFIDKMVKRFHCLIALRRNQRPVIVIFRAFRNPGFENLNLLGSQRFVGLGWRH